jgi:hypothetical protein
LPNQTLSSKEYIEIIVERFDPFNEVVRYPVARTRPEGGAWTSIYPTDMHVMDYFIYKMRQVVPVPPKHNDIFKSGGDSPYFPMFPVLFPHLLQKLKEDNINFE